MRKCLAETKTYINKTVFEAWYNGNASNITDLVLSHGQYLWVARNTSLGLSPWDEDAWTGNISSQCNMHADLMLRAVKAYFV